MTGHRRGPPAGGRGFVAALLLAAIAVLTGCGSDTPPIVSVRGDVDSTELEIAVDTCNAHPTATVVGESETQVRLRVTAQRSWGDADCADSVVVTLASPLRDREVVDDSSGRRLDVVRSDR